MEQLKMYLLPGTKIPEYDLPEGYSISHIETEDDIREWCLCCCNGQLIDEKDFAGSYKSNITDRPIDPKRDVFFLDYHGEHVATATTYRHPENNTGDLHMIGMKTEWRGKGLSKYVLSAALRNPSLNGVTFTHLTTDDFRVGAVRSYLNFGFLPVDYDADMTERWEKMLAVVSVPEVRMLADDASFEKMIYAKTE